MHFVVEIFSYMEKKQYFCTRYDLPRFPLDQRTRGGLRVLYGVYLRLTSDMKYQKQPSSIAEQIAKLEGRGLLFEDKGFHQALL